MTGNSAWKKCVFACLTLFAVFACLELGFRWAENRGAETPAAPEAYLRPALQPVNAQALRRKFLEKYQQKGEDEYRIVCMGDSVTHGFRMDRTETYPAKLEAYLENAGPAGRRVRVINAGQVGTSLVQGVKYYRDTIRHLKPDMVIAGYGINDHFYNPTPDLERVRIAPEPIVKLQSILRKSACYRVLKNALRESDLPRELKSVRVSPTEFRDFLHCLHRDLTEDGVTLVLMNALSANYDMVLLDYSRVMATFCEENQVLFIDLYKYFAEFAGLRVDFLGGDNILYKSEQIRLVEPLKMTNTDVESLFIDAYHPNARGYDIIAGIVADRLQVKVWKKSQ